MSPSRTDPSASGPYRLKGAVGSPYSLKMRAALRYRRLPHVWETGQASFATAQSMRAPVIPVLQFPNGELKNDSTPLLAELDALHAGRELTPPDPADRFLALLIEDFADEWLTKAMFAYRWTREIDQRVMSRRLAWDFLMGGGEERIVQAADMFRDRQVGRMARVGCTEESRPLVEASADRVMAALDAHVVERPFLFGDRPSVAELALYGQLTQLAGDPTPSARMQAERPWLFRWLTFVDDLSGWAGEAWRDPGEPWPEAVRALVAEAGALHLPFLIANDAALRSGAETFVFEAAEGRVEQGPDRYQGKCLATLRALWAALDADARARLTPLFDDTGVRAALEAA